MFEKLKGRLGGENLDSLRNLFVQELRDLISAHEQMQRAVPRIVEDADYVVLKSVLQQQADLGTVHIDRLKAMLGALAENTDAGNSLAMEGLIKEATRRSGMSGYALVVDAGLVSVVERMIEYLLVSYGLAIDYAELLGESNAQLMLDQTRTELESGADQLSDSVVELFTMNGRREHGRV